MPYYLVSQKTELGRENSRKRQENVADFTNEAILRSVDKVMCHKFPWQTLIRQQFKADRSSFCNGNASSWDAWLDGEDSQIETISQCGQYRFFWMECDIFDTLDLQQRRDQGLVR